MREASLHVILAIARREIAYKPLPFNSQIHVSPKRTVDIVPYLRTYFGPGGLGVVRVHKYLEIPSL